MKIRYKILLIFVLQVTSIITLLEISVYYFSSLERKSGFEKRLTSRANYSAQLYMLLGDSSFSVMNRVDSSSSTGLLHDRTIAIIPDRGPVVYQFENPDFSPLRIDQMPLQKGNAYFNIGAREAVVIRHTTSTKSFYVVVAAYDEEGLSQLNELGKFLWISLVLAVALTALVGWTFSKSLLKPIAQMMGEVNDISSRNLTKRLRTRNEKDELGQLADIFNRLLERLQKSFDSQRLFISNASHELFTPLTSVFSQLDIALQKERSAAEYKEVLISVHEDVQHMRQLVRSLLELAKADSGGNIELSEVRIDEVLLRITSEMKKLGRNYRVDLDFGEVPEEENDFLLFGNPELIHSAIKNVVENGCKYAPDKTVYVHLQFRDHWIYIRIENKGNSIESGEIGRLFQPFFRGAGAKGQRGSGLGLALADLITRLHKGRLEVSAESPEMTTFTVVLPSLNRYI